MMAIKRSEKLWALTERELLQVRADRQAAQVDDANWVGCSAGDAAKGPRVYHWAAAEIQPLRQPGKGHWLSARRSVANGGTGLLRLLWPVGNGLGGTGQSRREALDHRGMFEEAKGQVGLDQYEVRRRNGRYRHITLAMLPHAFLTVIRNQAAKQRERGSATAPMKN